MRSGLKAQPAGTAIKIFSGLQRVAMGYVLLRRQTHCWRAPACADVS